MSVRRTGEAARRWAEDEGGVVTVEAVIILPLLFWALMATFVFVDVFRVGSASQKAAYTVADALSRQTEPVDAAYVAGLNRVHDLLARTRNPTAMRVSSIGWDAGEGRHVVIWSVPTGGRAPLATAELRSGMDARLPTAIQGETIILVETSVDYAPLFRVGIPPQTFRQAVVTRPRFAPQVAFDDAGTIIRQPLGPPRCDDGPPLCA